MQEFTAQCKICGKPYKYYPYYAGDQSACPDCRKRAKENMKPNTPNAGQTS